MSIYEGRSGLTGYEDVHEPPVGRNAQATPSDSSAGPRDWLRLRKAMPMDCLLSIGGRWLGQLPPDLYPSALATQYPRIVNLMALQWDESEACPAYFEQILVDRRGARQGFPPEIQRELLRLRDYWYTRERTPKGIGRQESGPTGASAFGR